MALAILEKVLVTSEGNMDDRTFRKHMNLRHPESLGYLGDLKPRPSLDAHMMVLWRIYHGALHRFRIDLAHEHGDG